MPHFLLRLDPCNWTTPWVVLMCISTTMEVFSLTDPRQTDIASTQLFPVYYSARQTQNKAGLEARVTAILISYIVLFSDTSETEPRLPTKSQSCLIMIMIMKSTNNYFARVSHPGHMLLHYQTQYLVSELHFNKVSSRPCKNMCWVSMLLYASLTGCFINKTR